MSSAPTEVLSGPSAEALELPTFLKVVSELAASDLGRQKVIALRPLAERSDIETRQTLVMETGRLLEEFTLVPSFEEPVAPLVRGLVDGDRLLSGADLRRLAEALVVVQTVGEKLGSSEIDAPKIAALAQTDAEVDALCDRIQKSLDRRGRIRDNASPKLVELRKRVQRVRDSLYKQLQETLIANTDDFAETTVSLKDGRLTLLLNSGAKGRSKGLVHGKSGTGQSFYFEPFEAVEANNSLQEALEEEEVERRRILNQLIEDLAQVLPSIEAQLEVLGELDSLQCISRFGAQGECEMPEISRTGLLELFGARHPLLDPAYSDLRQRALGQPGHTSPIVPLNMELDATERVLVITGPNAGGKTVALKTTGLLAMIAQCGMPIPALGGSRVPVFGAVMAMVGDEQDLLSDRSTFSARLMRLKEAWEVASEDSLVLLDELGSGTDPEEGAALAIALLEGLLERRTLGVITTHLTQLSAVALESKGAVCAAMEFDPESGEPTYRLRPGAPGGSEALALAGRLGLPVAWIRRAEEYLGGEHRDLRRLLQEVERVRAELAEAESQVRRKTRELEKGQAEVREEMEAVEAERKQQKRRLKRELDEFRRKVTDQLREEFETLRGQFEKGRTKNLVAESAGRLFEAAPQLEDHEDGAGPVSIGNQVRHRSLRWEGILEKVRGCEAEVSVKGKRFKCAVDDLVSVGENAVGETARSTPSYQFQPEKPSSGVADELNLVGHRVDPALEKLDRYLDQALLGDRDEVRVVHGFGSGRLRRAVRKHLGASPAVAEFRSGDQSEGGDGATVVILSKG